jgi:hypothetical protein
VPDNLKAVTRDEWHALLTAAHRYAEYAEALTVEGYQAEMVAATGYQGRDDLAPLVVKTIKTEGEAAMAAIEALTQTRANPNYLMTKAGRAETKAARA